MTIALVFSLGTCIVQIQSVRLNYACTKRLFNLSAEAIINARNARLCARCAILLLKFKQIPFSCRLAKVFTFLKRAQNQFKMLLETCIVRASIVPTEKNANLLAIIYGCGKCGAWLFVLFILQQHVKTTKTDRKRCFFAKKVNLVPNKQLLPNVPFQYSGSRFYIPPNTERKNFVWTTNYRRLLEMCTVQHVEMKSVITFQPIKRLVSTTVKSAKPAATF